MAGHIKVNNSIYRSKEVSLLVAFSLSSLQEVSL